MHFFYDFRLDLHGFNPDDAITEIDNLITINENASIMIIHGRGSGILKKVVRKFCEQSSFVKSVEYGEDLNLPGTDGITVIYTT